MTAATATSTARPEIVFTMGLPGAGKSTVIDRLGLLATHGVIDPDLIKTEQPDYDPKRPEVHHEWSSEEAERRFQAALAAGSESWIVDGTGTNAEKMIRRIREAQAAGFTTRLLYVRVRLATALSRNASRERVVPEAIVREKARDVATAFELVAASADAVQVVNND